MFFSPEIEHKHVSYLKSDVCLFWALISDQVHHVFNVLTVLKTGVLSSMFFKAIVIVFSLDNEGLPRS